MNGRVTVQTVAAERSLRSERGGGLRRQDPALTWVLAPASPVTVLHSRGSRLYGAAYCTAILYRLRSSCSLKVDPHVHPMPQPRRLAPHFPHEAVVELRLVAHERDTAANLVIARFVLPARAQP